MAVGAGLSLRDTRDVDPYPLYEALRGLGPVVRDEGMAAWLVLDHAGCALVERDEDLFEEPTGSLPGAAQITGRRDLRSLKGPEHDVLHRALSHAWRPGPIAHYAGELIRPILGERLASLAKAGRFELFSDVASIVPIRIIARILGLPDEDDVTLRRTKGWLEAVLAWRHTYGADEDVREGAIEATRQLAPHLLGVIRERRRRPSGDMISWLWTAGSSVAGDWDEDDVLANATFLFEAGSETTSLLICSVMKRLLDEPGPRRSAILDDALALRWFIEEVLRHSTVVHWRARRATRDVALGGATIRAGDMVHPVNAAANRDPTHWDRADEFDPGRSRLASHLAFNVGPRHCAGAHLSRLQAVEVVTALFRAFPDLHVDTDAPPPTFAGYVTRAWRPLSLRHAPREGRAVHEDVVRASPGSDLVSAYLAPVM
jgi:cytochrome P450